jgi:hypothetical protein
VVAKFFRHLAVAALAGSLAAAMLPAAFTTAATPVWDMTVVAIPGTVSPGSVAAYKVTVFNKGKSNIAKLYLTEQSGDPVVYSDKCAMGVALNCSLGALKAKSNVSVIVAYTTPDDGSTTFERNFEATTSGVAYNQDNSHGDTLGPIPGTTTLNSSSHFKGGFILDGGPVNTDQTTVNTPESNIAVTIEEGGSGVSCGGTGIGLQADIHINGGATYAITPGTPLMSLKISTSGIPDETELSAFYVCHKYDDGTPVKLSKCADATDSAGVVCFWPQWDTQTGHDDHGQATDADDWAYVILDVYDTNNGGLRGSF